MGHLIAVVGSPWARTDKGDQKTDPLSAAQEQRARDACVALGKELAKQDFQLMVYSAEPRFMEGDLVRGYAPERNDGECIVFKHPQDKGGQFPEQLGDKSHLFKDLPEGTPDWEVTFYRSLKDADGVLLLGGGYSTEVCGYLAMVLDIPIATAATFGGGAQKVWRHLEHDAQGVAKQEVSQMGAAWTPISADKLVSSLKRRCDEAAARKAAADNKVGNLESLVKDLTAQLTIRATRGIATILLLASLVVLAGLFVVATSTLATPDSRPITFMLALIVAGAAGACVSVTQAGATTQALFTTLVRGMVAGFLFSLLYMVPIWMGSKTSGAAEGKFQLDWLQFVLAMLVAMGAGLAADSVFDAFRAQTTGKASAVITGGLPGQSGKAAAEPKS
jgi:hypothetical protein